MRRSKKFGVLLCTLIILICSSVDGQQHNPQPRYIDGKVVYSITNPSTYDRSTVRSVFIFFYSDERKLIFKIKIEQDTAASQPRYLPAVSSTSSASNSGGGSYSTYANETATLNSLQDRINALEADRNKKIDGLDYK